MDGYHHQVLLFDTFEAMNIYIIKSENLKEVFLGQEGALGLVISPHDQNVSDSFLLLQQLPEIINL